MPSTSPASAEIAAAARPLPWFVVEPPTGTGTVVRQRLLVRLESAVSVAPVTHVCAPSGYGKTVAVADWTRATALRVVWITADPGSDLGQLTAALWTALARRFPDDPPPVPQKVGASGAHGVGAWAADRDVDLAIVIDDAGAAVPGSVERLIQALDLPAHPRLRLVVIDDGRVGSFLPLDRWQWRVASIAAEDLLFQRDEAARLAPMLPGDAVAYTGGWPALVALAAAAPAEEWRDYVQQRILAALPVELRRFVQLTSVCSHFDERVARALTGRSDVCAVLDDARRRGLPVTVFESDDGETVYRWHETLARAARDALRRDDPDAWETAHRTLAATVADRFPLAAADLLRTIDDIPAALAVVDEHWIEIVVDGRASRLDRFLSTLPRPWATSGAVLALRACCVRVGGDHLGARLLAARVRDGVHRPLHALFLEDDPDSLVSATRGALEELVRRDYPPTVQAYGLFAVGWTLLHARRDPDLAWRLLRTARDEAATAGLEALAARAGANLAFAVAFAGRFAEAERLLADLPGGHDAVWVRYDGGIETITRGYIQYWRGELGAAGDTFRDLIRRADGTAYADLARIYLIFLAADGCDRDDRARLGRDLAEVPRETRLGVPWGTWCTIAEALLARSAGRPAEAAALARRTLAEPVAPHAQVLAADVLRWSGDGRAAAAVLDGLPRPTTPANFLVEAEVVRALIALDAGSRSVAHERLERALDVAEPERVRRPFLRDGPRFAELLARHIAWGSRHPEEITALIALRLRELPPSELPLSAREREVYELLRTALSTVQIADSLGLSMNTVKTHVRSIYRKLGVRSRREAVQRAR